MPYITLSYILQNIPYRVGNSVSETQEIFVTTSSHYITPSYPSSQLRFANTKSFYKLYYIPYKM
jgi:hypothetical protein